MKTRLLIAFLFITIGAVVANEVFEELEFLAKIDVPKSFATPVKAVKEAKIENSNDQSKYNGLLHQLSPEEAKKKLEILQNRVKGLIEYPPVGNNSTRPVIPKTSNPGPGY